MTLGETIENGFEKNKFLKIGDYNSQIAALNSLKENELPCVIVCRVFDFEREQDKKILEILCPQLGANAVLLDSPKDIYLHLKTDRPNVVFLGYYFHDKASQNGPDVARDIKGRGYPVRTVLVTSSSNTGGIENSPFDAEYTYLDQSNEEFIRAKYLMDNIIQSLQIVVPEPDQIKKFGEKDVLEFVLGVLNQLSDKEEIKALFDNAIKMGYANSELLLSLQEEYISLLPLQMSYSDDVHSQEKLKKHEAIRDKILALMEL